LSPELPSQVEAAFCTFNRHIGFFQETRSIALIFPAAAFNKPTCLRIAHGLLMRIKQDSLASGFFNESPLHKRGFLFEYCTQTKNPVDRGWRRKSNK
jgi:hypothetical protein